MTERQALNFLRMISLVQGKLAVESKAIWPISYSGSLKSPSTSSSSMIPIRSATLATCKCFYRMVEQCRG